MRWPHKLNHYEFRKQPTTATSCVNNWITSSSTPPAKPSAVAPSAAATTGSVLSCSRSLASRSLPTSARSWPRCPRPRSDVGSLAGCGPAACGSRPSVHSTMAVTELPNPMKHRTAAIVLSLAALAFRLSAADLVSERPRIGKVDIFKAADLRPGMQGTAWTVFAGKIPEQVPVEILGLWKNAWGPRQDVILAKLGGKAVRTNVAGGMSGSPVYIDGKLVGAIALRLSVFSPDAICGITPAELMLEINDIDQSRPGDARTPDKAAARSQVAVPGDLLAQAVAAGASESLPRQAQMMVPIETPLMFSGFRENVLRDFGPLFQQLGISAVAGGGASSATYTAK